MRVIVVFCVRLPDVPVMVMVLVPATAPLPAVKVRVLPVVVLAGVNANVTPAGKPAADRLTLPVKPLAGMTRTVLELLPPGVTATVPGTVARLKFRDEVFVLATTLRLVVVVRVRPPPVPTMVTVTGFGVTVAVLLAVKVNVLALVVPAGLNDAVTPFGTFTAERVTMLSNPLPVRMVTTVVVLDPWLTVRMPGVEVWRPGTVSEKLGAELVPASALINACPCGLPQPVQRSYPATAENMPGKLEFSLLPVVMS